MACEEELTRIPIRHTIEQVRGIAKSWGYSAAAGVFARDAKSGALLCQVIAQVRQAPVHQVVSDLRDESGRIANTGHEAHDHGPG
ncbi:hypothetical protein ID866_333 [Astraeus odoratus]|nr:hypothetical protein ID866_333 [Astraeus odoratus]